MPHETEFAGDSEDLERFMRLVNSPVHSEERGRALDEWRTFNRIGTLPPGLPSTKKMAMWQAYQKPRGVDLRGARLAHTFLGKADLQGASLDRADFANAKLKAAHFDHARLDGADFTDALLLGATFEKASLKNCVLRNVAANDATFRGADLSGADFSGSNLSGVDLSAANLHRADFTGTNLSNAVLVKANVADARFDGAVVYGLSAWDLAGEPRSSEGLVITEEPPTITVGNLKVAQFLYLIYRNPEIREVLDTITRKVVLILGRFSPPRKAVLDRLRDELRKRGLVPVIFDWDPSVRRDLTETVSLLANMARFVIADLTDASSIPQELSAIIPNLPSVPVKPLLLATEEEYAMFEHWRRFPSVLPVYRYADVEALVDEFDAAVIAPIESWESTARDSAAREASYVARIAELERRLAERDA